MGWFFACFRIKAGQRSPLSSLETTPRKFRDYSVAGNGLASLLLSEEEGSIDARGGSVDRELKHEDRSVAGNGLASLFLSEEEGFIDDWGDSVDRELQHQLRGGSQALDFQHIAKFLKACGALLEILAEIRKGPLKTILQTRVEDEQPDASCRKLQWDDQPDHISNSPTSTPDDCLPDNTYGNGKQGWTHIYVEGGNGLPQPTSLKKENKKNQKGGGAATSTATVAPVTVPAWSGFGGRSFAQVLAAAPLFECPRIPVHPPAFTDDGEPAVFFSPEEVTAALASFRLALVAKTPYGRPPYPDIKLLLSRRLCLGGEFIISALDSRHLLIRCTSEDDYLHILLREQILIKGFFFKFFKWSPDFECGRESPIVPVWVEFPALKPFLFQEPYIRSIAGNVGRVLQVALRTSQLTDATAARACVELNVLEPRPSRLWVSLGSSGYWQDICYPNLPVYCTSCFLLGHSVGTCRRNSKRQSAHLASAPAQTSSKAAGKCPAQEWIGKKSMTQPVALPTMVSPSTGLEDPSSFTAAPSPATASPPDFLEASAEAPRISSPILESSSLYNHETAPPTKSPAEGLAGVNSEIVLKERSLTSKSSERDRPIIGMVAAHWIDEEATRISPKLWNGNGIPNSTNKYKEDQRVIWYDTSFEERLEKALSDEKLFPQRELLNGKPIRV